MFVPYIAKHTLLHISFRDEYLKTDDTGLWRKWEDNVYAYLMTERHLIVRSYVHTFNYQSCFKNYHCVIVWMSTQVEKNEKTKKDGLLSNVAQPSIAINNCYIWTPWSKMTKLFIRQPPVEVLNTQVWYLLIPSKNCLW